MKLEIMLNDFACSDVVWGDIGLMNRITAWGILRWDEICYIDDCCQSANVSCEVWKNENRWNAGWFWSVFSDKGEVDCSVCWDDDDCIDSMEISDIAEKNSTDLNICCENVVGNAVTDANKNVENAVKDFEISNENVETNANKNAKNTAENAVENAVENTDKKIF